jgi:hypothetical protein
MDPLAREKLSFMGKLALVLSSLAVVRHKVFAKIKFKVVSRERLLGLGSFGRAKRLTWLGVGLRRSRLEGVLGIIPSRLT